MNRKKSVILHPGKLDHDALRSGQKCIASNRFLQLYCESGSKLFGFKKWERHLARNRSNTFDKIGIIDIGLYSLR